MNLGAKLVVLLLAPFVGYAGVELAVQRFVLLPSFVDLERATARRNAERAVEALQREVELLAPSAQDWAVWDATYAFVHDRDPGFVASSLNAEAVSSLHAHLLALYDERGQLAWGMAYDPETETTLDLGELSAAALRLDHPLFGPGDGDDAIAGVVRTKVGPLLVASHPILTSAGAGPSRGRVVIGRRLDEGAVARLATQTRIALDVTLLAPDGPSPTDLAETGAVLASTPVTLVEGEDSTRSSTTVLDLDRRPLLRIDVDTPRRIVAEGKATLRIATASLAVVALLAAIVLLLVLGRTVIAPVRRLTRHAVAVGIHGDLEARIDLARRDELGVLAAAFDRTVEQLVDTRRRLVEQSFRSGIAEMASGVLHNIGNAVTPLGVRLANLRAELSRAPVEEMEIATAELARRETPADRRADMEAFVALAGQELAALVRRSMADVDAIRTHVGHVQQILVEQQRVSRAERVTEAIDLASLFDETLRLLPDAVRGLVSVELDPQLARDHRVRGTRVLLQQVVANLLINAAEAIRERAGTAEPGRVRVLAELDTLGGARAVHLRFEDNGMGISAEHLPHLFEHGFSTKSRGSGSGLHWCANTVNAAGGRLRAESDGPGRGATIHLLLPTAEASAVATESAT